MKQWETSALYKEVKSRPSEDGSLHIKKGANTKTVDTPIESKNLTNSESGNSNEAFEKNLNENIQTETNIEARRRCLHLLEYSPRTAYQLRKRLIDDGFTPEQAEDAVRYAESFGYVNDSNYAMEYVRTGCQKKSKRELYMKLSSRGVDKASIEEALEAYDDEQEQTVRRLARKRLMQKPPKSNEDLLKAVKSLVSKGFPYEMAKRAVWELKEEYDF